MTGLEQALTYIEREIRFMSKDHAGGFTNARYADKVIEEVCGIPHFCSRVLSSQKPLSTIFKYTSGNRGNILMKFFNASLHDTRIDITMVLAESERLKKFQDKKSRNAYAYMTKLYQKSVAKMIKLLTGSKSKETYKSMYKELCSFANMRPKKKTAVKVPSFIDDEDEDDNLDYTSEDELQESFDPEYLEAISKKVELVEKTLGRNLTYKEIDDLISHYDEEDEDDDDFDDEEDEDDDDDVIDEIASRVVAMLAPQLGLKVAPSLNPVPPFPAKPTESLDEFLERVQTEYENDNQKETNTSDDSFETSPVEVGVDYDFNDTQESIQTSEPIVEINEDASSEQLIRYHNFLPDNPNKVISSSEIKIEDFTEGKEESTEKDSEGDSDTVDNPTDEKSSVGVTTDYIANFDITSWINEFTDALNAEANSCTFDGTEVEISDVIVTLEPSEGEDQLVNLNVQTRYLGTYDCFDPDPILTRIRELQSKLSKTLEIPIEKIDYDFSYAVGDSTYNEDLKALQEIADKTESGKLYTKDSITKIYSVASVLVCYIYKKYNYEVKVSIVNDPKNKLTKFYLANKHKKSDQSKENNILTDLPVIIGLINNVFNSNIEAQFNPDSDDNSDKVIFEKEYVIIEDQVYKGEFINSTNAEIDKNITYQFDYFSPNDKGETPKPVNQYVANDVIITNKGVLLDTEFTIQVTKSTVDQDDFEEMVDYISSKAEYKMKSYAYLHAMVSDISVRTKISKVEVEPENK